MTEPRAYTSEEATKMFIDHVRTMVMYWNNLPGLDMATGIERTQLDRLDGLAFSILTLLDGDSMALPMCRVLVDPHPADKAYHQSEGENWFEPETELDGPLHELFYAKEG